MRFVLWIVLFVVAVMAAAFLWFREATDIHTRGPLPTLQTGDILFMCKQRVQVGDLCRYMPMSFYLRTGFVHAGIVVENSIYHLTQPHDQYRLPGLNPAYIYPDGPRRGGIQCHTVTEYIRAYEAAHAPLWLLFRPQQSPSPKAWIEAIERFRDCAYTCEGRLLSILSAFLFRSMDTETRELQCCSFIGRVLEELDLIPTSVAPLSDYVPAKLQATLTETNAYDQLGVFETPEELQCWCKRSRFHMIL